MPPTRDGGDVIDPGSLSRDGVPAWFNKKITVHGRVRRTAGRPVRIQSATAVLQHHAHRYGTRGFFLLSIWLTMRFKPLASLS